jgi:F0F1-type ATP synthase assembly protein I
LGARSAGDVDLTIHPKLVTGFGPKLAAQADRPLTDAGERAGHHFGRSLAHGVRTAGVAVGAGIAVVGALAVRGLLKTTAAASDLNETVSKTQVIFGKSSPTIMRWSKGTTTAMGLTRNEALTNASAFGDMFRQLGIGLPTTTKMSTKLVGLASDLASFSNADISQVLEAQQAAFRGEYDSLQKFVPAINAARVQQVALSQTHKKSAQDLTAAEKAQATYTIMMHDTVRAQGDFNRTSQGQANQQRILSAQWGGLKTVIGQGFLPAQLAVTRAMTSKLMPALTTLATNLAPRVGAGVTRIARSLAGAIPSSRDLSLGIRALGLAFHGEGITTSSDKFVGKMERLGVFGRKVVDMAKGLQPALEGIGSRLAEIWKHANTSSTGLSQVSGKGQALNSTLGILDPLLASAASGGRLFGSSIHILAPILDVVARNMHNIVPWLPQILLGFLAFRAVKSVLGPVRELGEMVRNFTTPALAIATLAQARSQRLLAVAMREQGAASRGAAVAQGEANAAQNAGALASVRARTATIAQGIAAKAMVGATKVWAGVQWVLNAAMSANPLVLVTLLIAGLVAGIVIAYKKSETFRRIVDSVWSGIKKGVGAAVNFILGMIKNWLDAQFELVAGILHIMGKLPGPMGAPFRAAEKAVRGAKKTVDEQIGKIQQRVNRLTGKDIPVSASLKLNFSPSYTQKDWVADRQRAGRMAGGGLLRGPGGPRGDRIPIMGSDREFMQPADAVDYYGVPFMEAIRKKRLRRFATGGPIGRIDTQTDAVNKIEAHGTGVRLRKALATFVSKFGGGDIKAFIRAADALPYIWGGVGPGGYDCSGLTGEVFARMTHRPSYRRYFTTASNFTGVGFKPGPGGAYTIGVNRGHGHMVGNYRGLPFEAESTRTGIKVGAAATSVGSMPAQYHLARGGLIDLAEWARRAGVSIGGDPAKLRIERLDQGGLLRPGHFGYNGTRQAERVLPPGADSGVITWTGNVLIYAAPGMSERDIARLARAEVVDALDEADRRRRKGRRV